MRARNNADVKALLAKRDAAIADMLGAYEARAEFLHEFQT